MAKPARSLGIEGKGHERGWDTEMTEELKSSKDKFHSLENFVISEILSNQMQVNFNRSLCNKDRAFPSFIFVQTLHPATDW